MAGRILRRRFSVSAAIVVLIATAAVAAPNRGARAAPGQLTPVSGFGSNPGNLLMFEWIPNGLPPNAPVVVVLHGCFASATVYDDETGWTALAERWKVALVFPEQTVANDPSKCFRWWNPEDNVREHGEALSVKQMIDWEHANHGTDPSRVFIMGHSGGALFTSVMLATYPDVFRAGAIVAGGPYKCGDEGPIAVGIDGSKSPVRGGECVDGSVDKTPQQWGDLARSGDPGYTGPKPRVSIWHGTADTEVSFKNLKELVEQWTNYHGIDQTPDVSDTVKGYPHRVYEDRRGQPLVESYELTDQSHGWPYDPGTAEDQCNGAPPSWNDHICGAYFAGRWFGLDSSPGCAAPPAGNPERPPCPSRNEAAAPASRDTTVAGSTVERSQPAAGTTLPATGGAGLAVWGLAALAVALLLHAAPVRAASRSRSPR